MIHNANYGNTKNIPIAVFGTGDIAMVGSIIDENGMTVLGFKSVDNGNPINVQFSIEEISFDEWKPDLIFMFNKIESIDSIINMLIICKNQMIDNNKINEDE